MLFELGEVKLLGAANHQVQLLRPEHTHYLRADRPVKATLEGHKLVFTALVKIVVDNKLDEFVFVLLVHEDIGASLDELNHLYLTEHLLFNRESSTERLLEVFSLVVQNIFVTFGLCRH